MILTRLNQRPIRALVSVVAALGLLATLAPAAAAQVAPMSGCMTYADADHVVFCRATATGSELFELGPEGSVRQLTHLGGRIDSADAGLDGRYVAFQASVGQSGTPQVYVVERHGPRARKVAVGSAIVEIGQPQVMVGWSRVDLPVTAPQRLTREGTNVDPSFTPDGSRIGFVSDRPGQPSLWSMDIDGGDQRQLLVATVD